MNDSNARTPAATGGLVTDYVDYGDGDTALEGYRAVPVGLKSSAPGVILCHDWSGPNAGTRAIAERIAGLGHPCFAVDLYGKGVRGDELGDNSALMNPMLENRGLLQRRLLAGFEAAKRKPEFDGDRLAVLGYCFGGLCALDLARAAPQGLRGAVSVHGVLKPPGIPLPGRIEASVLVLHGWDDPVAPPPDVLELARELTEAGADWQLHAYGHAMHAFTFESAAWPERGIAYHPAAARRAWGTLTGFISEILTD